jgi:DNA topoisomerase I
MPPASAAVALRAPAHAPPLEHARHAGLRYAIDDAQAITRHRRGAGFGYRDPHGRAVRDARTLARIRGLVIPPAWTDVRIAMRPNAHLQATGRDARGRKQYRYHPRWRDVRDGAKYARLIAFGRALPGLRARCAADQKGPALGRARILATVVELLDRTHIRVGNAEYAKANGSFGLTTLQDRHVAFPGGAVVFSFKGKSGVRQEVRLEDPRLAAVVRRCRDLPGQELFQYLDGDGAVQDVGSSDVNAYVREIAGEAFSTKDFRTWAGTVLACVSLAARPVPASTRHAAAQITAAVKQVAARLGNTPAVARRCYIHPAVFDAFRDGRLQVAMAHPVGAPPRRLRQLSADERRVLGLLEATTAVARRRPGGRGGTSVAARSD